jgi:calmodulin
MINSKENEFIRLLSEQEICELHEAFNIFDINSNGTIEKDKLFSLLFSLKQYPTKVQLEGYINELKLDEIDQINFHQFLKILGKILDIQTMDEKFYFKTVFDSLDRDKKGRISIHEIKHIVSRANEKISVEDLDKIFKKVDNDNDKYINFDEFLNFMKD